jgi:hypothetical protein
MQPVDRLPLVAYWTIDPATQARLNGLGKFMHDSRLRRDHYKRNHWQGVYLANGTSLCQAAAAREETNLLNLGGVRGLQP